MWGLPHYNPLFNITPYSPFLSLTEEECRHLERLSLSFTAKSLFFDGAPFVGELLDAISDETKYLVLCVQ